MASNSLQGSCACGSTTFTSTSTSTPSHLDFCYCVQCQRQSGGPFIAWLGMPRSTLTLSGPVAQVRLSAVATRSFCAACGSALTMQYDCYPQKTHVAAGTLTQSAAPLPKVGVHIFVKSKPVWYEIPDDGVPRYEEFDGEFEREFPRVVEMLREG